MSAPPKFAYCVDSRGNYHPPNTVGHYLAGASMGGGHTEWDPELAAWKRKATSIYSQRDLTPEELEETSQRLVLAVPGLKVIKTEHVPAKTRRYHDYDTGFTWFTWSREAEDARLQELWEKYGVADWRLELYDRCHWTEEEDQPSLPGIVHVEPYSESGGVVSSSYTGYAMKCIDGGFIQRITCPNQGGKNAEYFQRRACHVGNEKWLVGTRGDSEELLSLEIQGSPLDARAKKSLLYNLSNYPRDATQRTPFLL